LQRKSEQGTSRCHKWAWTKQKRTQKHKVPLRASTRFRLEDRGRDEHDNVIMMFIVIHDNVMMFIIILSVAAK
jgi:hypothetical protein